MSSSGKPIRLIVRDRAILGSGRERKDEGIQFLAERDFRQELPELVTDAGARLGLAGYAHLSAGWLLYPAFERQRA